MDLDLRLAGRRTVAFRCGCFFARGDDIGIAGWRLCGRHADRVIAVEVAFGTDCVVICPLDVEHVDASDVLKTDRANAVMSLPRPQPDDLHGGRLGARAHERVAVDEQ